MTIPGELSSLPPQRPISDEQKAVALRELNRSPKWTLLSEWAKSFLIAVVLFLLIRAFLVEAFKIPSGSMERTLLVGDFLLVNKFVYGASVPGSNVRIPAVRTPARGDIIVFQWPEDVSKNFVKRLVGLPGDTLAMREGQLVRNGEQLRENYVSHTDPGVDRASHEFSWQEKALVRRVEASEGYHPSRNNWGPLVVPPKSYFVLGDNRDNSLDSRYWGWVPDSLVRGQPLVVYYSYAPDSARRFAWISAIRWNRLGERVK